MSDGKEPEEPRSQRNQVSSPQGQELVRGPDSAHPGLILVVMMVPRALTPHWELAQGWQIPEAGLNYKDLSSHQLSYLDHVNPRHVRACPPRPPCYVEWADSSVQLD